MRARQRALQQQIQVQFERPRLRIQAQRGVVENQQFRMDIMGPRSRVDGLGAGVLRRVFRTEPGDPPLQGYRTIRTSLTPFAGRTVRLRFVEVDNVSNFQVGIDQVRIIVE